MRVWDDESMNDLGFEDRLTRALERAPEIAVPGSFALRVMQNLPQQRRMYAARTSAYGRKIAVAAMVLLAVALIATLFARLESSFYIYGLVPLITVQLGAIIFWLSTRQYRWR